MFGSCSSFNDSDEEDDSLPTSSPRPTRPTHCNKNVGNQHYSSRSHRCIFQRSPFLITNDNELMSRLSTLPMLDLSSAHKIGTKQQEASTSSSSKISPPSPPSRRRILPIPPPSPQLVTTATTIPSRESIKMPQSNSSKRPSGSCLRRSRFSFPSELSEIAARNVDYVLSDSKSVSFYSQVSVLEFENDEDDTDDDAGMMKVESWFKNFSRGFGIESWTQDMLKKERTHKMCSRRRIWWWTKDMYV